eukprot:12535668-Prorocentrum_lima.AAC.1
MQASVQKLEEELHLKKAQLATAQQELDKASEELEAVRAQAALQPGTSTAPDSMAAAALDQFNKVLASFPPELAGNSAMAQATSAVQAAAA